MIPDVLTPSEAHFADADEPSAPTTIREGLGLYFARASVVEVRILNTKRGVVSGYFDDLDTCVAAVTAATRQYPTSSIYATLNPVHRDLLARGLNRVRDYVKTGDTTKDKHIVKRVWLPIDVDPKRPSGISATDDQLDAALDVRDQLVQYLCHDLGWPRPVCAISGNGGHALFPVDLPNNDGSTQLLRDVLQTLNTRFGDDIVGIDLTMFNAARICKVYGTVACKGDNTPDRPHRLAQLESIPAALVTVTADQLAALASETADASQTHQSTPPNQSPSEDLIDFFTRRGWYVADLGGGCHRVVCPWAKTDHPGDESGTVLYDATSPEPTSSGWGFKCHHDHCTERTIRDVRELLGVARPYLRTDTGNAEFFGAFAADGARYDHARRDWFYWDGQHWKRDRTGEVDRLALASIRQQQKLAFTIADDAQRTAQLKWTITSENCAPRQSLLKLATKLERLAVTGDDWDTNPMLLGVANGVVDLATGLLRDGRPTDYLTKVAPIAFDATARAPRWTKFIAEIFADHPELTAYLQRVVGYSLTGLTTEQVFWILCGQGSNGKSLLMETIMHVLGEAYSWTMPFPTAGWSNAMSEYQKASLVGQRLLQASEVARGAVLNEDLIKSLTGDDAINARHPYGRPFTFKPTGKIFLRVNQKPIIRDQTHAMWRRVKLIPFTQTFPIDNTLGEVLRAEAVGILAWAVRGCLDWQRDGLQHPEIVENGTQDYRTESDTVQQFIDERCVVMPGVSVGAMELFHAYREWCDFNQIKSEDRLPQKALGLSIRQKEFEVVEGRAVRYSGIGLPNQREPEI